MNRGPGDLPDRLVAGDATDFERRLMDAVFEKRPSAAASARMARALGVTVTSVGTAAAAKAVAAEVAVSKATTVVATSVVWPWVSAGVLGLVAAGAVVGAQAWHAPRPEPAPISAPHLAPAVPAPSDPPPAPIRAGKIEGTSEVTSERTPAPAAAPRHRAHPAPTEGDLGDQIALVDSAREALSAGSPPRALEILRRYQDRYPSGSFRPEATATTIEALMKLGRESEARALATRFIAEHRGSLLAKRVAELVGI